MTLLNLTSVGSSTCTWRETSTTFYHDSWQLTTRDSLPLYKKIATQHIVVERYATPPKIRSKRKHPSSPFLHRQYSQSRSAFAQYYSIIIHPALPYPNHTASTTFVSLVDLEHFHLHLYNALTSSSTDDNFICLLVRSRESPHPPSRICNPPRPLFSLHTFIVSSLRTPLHHVTTSSRIWRLRISATIYLRY